MTPQTEAEDLRFVERSPDWLRFGGAVFLLIIAVSIAAGAAIDGQAPGSGVAVVSFGDCF